MWWEDHWLELTALIAFVSSWVDLRARVKALALRVEQQNGRVDQMEIDLAIYKGRWEGILQEREMEAWRNNK